MARRGAAAVYTRARSLEPHLVATTCRRTSSCALLEIRLGVEGVGVDAYLVQPGPLQRGRPLNVSSRTTYGDPPEPEVVLPCTSVYRPPIYADRSPRSGLVASSIAVLATNLRQCFANDRFALDARSSSFRNIFPLPLLPPPPLVDFSRREINHPSTR